MFSLRRLPRTSSYIFPSYQTRLQRASRGVASASDVSDRYVRLSKFWLATGGITATENEDALGKLIRAGYLRKSHAGIFHMLPLGQRVQEKLERLIDKYMLNLGASKVSLSSISSQALWQRTDRLEGYGPELFRFTDRKEVPYLLAPTHEEEITALVSNTVKSYKSLPLRLYQIGRKYRDEIRPRHGLLRSREFLMKDLYTFDYSIQTALRTYDQVRVAYSQLFDELKIPYLVAEASSGDIGGDLSHEYHLPASVGEDDVISCGRCDYVANAELAVARISPGPIGSESSSETNIQNVYDSVRVWRGISKDRSTLVNVWYPSSFTSNEISTYAIKSIVPDLDSSIGESTWLDDTAIDTTQYGQHHQAHRLVNIADYRLGAQFSNFLTSNSDHLPLLPKNSNFDISRLSIENLGASTDGEPLNMLRVQDGDDCPRCDSGKLSVRKAIELGHTFHLGTRYSEPLAACVNVPSNLIEGQSSSSTDDTMVAVPMQMGCHGIGISRIIGAITDHLADEKGLNWPRVIAPFEVVIIPGRNLGDDAVAVSDYLLSHSTIPQAETSQALDLVLDDRFESFTWKLKDADLVGYPVIVVLGKKWVSERLCEVQCRRLNITSYITLRELPVYINNLLYQL